MEPSARAYGLASRSPLVPIRRVDQHIGPMGYLGGKADYDVDWETLDDNKPGLPATAAADGSALPTILADRACPGQRRSIEASFKKSPSGAYQATISAGLCGRAGPGSDGRNPAVRRSEGL